MMPRHAPAGSQRRPRSSRSPRPPRRSPGALERHAPFVVHASGEPDPLTSVRAFAGRVPGVEPGRPRPVVYGRRAGSWLQYWMLFEYNSQDRGLLRTGRHEGDWEMIQLRLRRGRPVQAVYAQHSGAESCGFRWAARGGERPVVQLARGSHAAYFRTGLRDRTWPDPNDEADGAGPRMRPRLVRIDESPPAVDALPRPLGRHRGGLGPGRDGLAARTGVPAAGPLVEPGGLGRGGAAVHARGLRPARGVRRARDGDRGRAGGCGPVRAP